MVVLEWLLVELVVLTWSLVEMVVLTWSLAEMVLQTWIMDKDSDICKALKWYPSFTLFDILLFTLVEQM